MAMLSMRAPSMLPSIKCSNCGHEIEISMMGDHICGPQHSDAMPRGGPPMRVDSPQLNPYEDRHLKPTRFIPPRIDASAANQPYARRDVYASNSARSSESRSPVSPFISCRGDEARRPRNDYGRPSRPERRPSMELPKNLDCAFPPFPVSPMASTPRSDASSPGFFSDPNPYAQPPQRKPQPAQPVQRLPQQYIPQPQPPSRSTTPLSQHNRDEAKRDEFFSRKPSIGGSRPPPQQRQPAMERQDNPYALAQDNPYGQVTRAAPSRQPSPQEAYRPEPLSTQSRARAPTMQKGPPSRPSRPGGEVDNFIAMLKEDAGKPSSAAPVGMRPDLRSNTFPREAPNRILERTPSEPLHNMNRQPNQLPERAATTNDFRKPYNTTDNNMQTLPPRSSSRSGFRSDLQSQDAPPLPSTSYGGRPQDSHAPSHSSSSAGSSLSGAGSGARTGRTTPMSETSSVSNLDSKSPPRTLHSARHNPYNPYGATDPPPQNSYLPPTKAYAPNSPTGPSSDYNPYAAPPPSSNGGGVTHDFAPSAAGRKLPWSMTSDTAAPPTIARPGLERSPTDSTLASHPSSAGRARHTCRGCAGAIVGKSVKAADGRLTGRYHRACFGCHSCGAAFTSADFYVLNDRPYCERHYHELNGSLCTGCDIGIEGVYLETEDRKKWHAKCLCCSTCRETLGEDYFDVGGRVYCERHAVAEVWRLGGNGGGNGAGGMLGAGLNGGNGWRAERRRTRMGTFLGL